MHSPNMDKALRWFRNLLGLTKKPDNTLLHRQPPPATGKQKIRWSFIKSYSKKQHLTHQFTQLNPSKHAIVMAAATTAAAEAAVTAAQAATEVVRPTSRVGNSTATYVTGRKDDELWAAVKIQSAYRGHLARRARRVLKGLVKMQALVRGYIVRKQITRWMHQIQVLMRAQAQARAQHSQISESSQLSSKSSHFQHIGPTTHEEVEHGVRVQNTKQNQSPALRRNNSRSSGRINVNHESPQLFLASSRGGRSRRRWDLSRSYLSVYSYQPNYMAYTESSRAKVRSLNAPKQRV